MKYNGKEYYSQGDVYAAIEQENKQLEIDKIHWRDLYWEECEKNKRLKEENKKLKNIIGNIVYLYKEEPTELGEYVKSGFKCGMSN